MTAARIKHNSDLATQFIAAHQVSSRYPRVTEQVDCLPIEPGKLVRHGYNPSIIEDGDGLLMAYRYHDGNTLATKLALAELGFDGKVLSNRTLEVPADGAVSVEDQKLFRWNDAVWMEWVQSTWPNFPVSSVVKYGRLDGNKVVNVHQIEPPSPKTVEKNIVPMPDGDTLSFIYECEPEQVIFTIHDDGVCHVSRYAGSSWPYGQIRGGTVPLEHEGKLLRFFHSGLDNEFGAQRRRYFLGALLMEPDPPFAVVAVGKKPIAYGSELDNLKSAERSKCVQYKRNVVFPGGAVARNGEFLVSVGVNDSACAILRIKPEQLNL